MTNWRNAKTEELFKAFLQLNNAEEVAAFCRDLMTESEIEEFTRRWEAARLLSEGNPQRKVASETGTSIATITRVNQWLRRGMGGYQLVLNRLVSHQHPRRG